MVKLGKFDLQLAFGPGGAQAKYRGIRRFCRSRILRVPGCALFLRRRRD